MPPEIEELCRDRFKNLSTEALVKRANKAPDFGWDDEAVELGRRRRTSNGKLEFTMMGNTIVITKNETD